MSQYKKIMLQRGVMQKTVTERVQKVDPRVDTSLISKFVNDVCLPTPRTLDTICKTLSCAPLDIYDLTEITLAPQAAADAGTTDAPAEQAAAATNTTVTELSAEAAKKRKRRRENGLYNLTVEISRDVAERVFAPEALRKLGYLSKSDFVRQAVAALDARLRAIETKEKAADAGTSNGDNK